MTDSVASIIPQLSIGVIAVLSLAVSIYFFLRYLSLLDKANRDEREQVAISNAEERSRYISQIEEHHAAIRAFEKDIRENLLEHLTNATETVKENVQLMARVARILDGNRHD